MGAQEELDFNALGLNFGIDLNAPALHLPFWARLGFKDVTTSDPAVQARPTAQMRPGSAKMWR
ncbi:MAG: hypothetical protein A2461_03905 [Burkholderiales bacterium RIFOXYC2_FULL_59_8]|nr:MAG: hypothetical protein A2461_03905 [Burkholderiales bacterium RIFOXYC2_FULL_59_8]OGB53589.1 MAG: hypothetical protein A2503_05665 [Burkholderiales bacterium RIFOXYD12_FULL_59_19]